MIILAVVFLVAVLIFGAAIAYSIPATVDAYYQGQAAVIIAEGRAAAMQTQANGEWWLNVTPLLLGAIGLALATAILFVILYNRKSDNDTRIVLAFIAQGYTPLQIYSERYKALPTPENHPMIQLSNHQYKQLESRVNR